jgi:hypothetical protein
MRLGLRCNQEPWAVDNILAPLDKLPSGSKTDDFDEWHYNREKDKIEPYISVTFRNGKLETIKCYATAEGTDCSDVLGIVPGTNEAEVKARLGKPDDEELDGVAKILRYYRYRGVFYLTKLKVYILGISAEQKSR